MSEKYIDPKQMKGNKGEQYIAQQLSDNNCFIRHVPQGHDIGIDLYCESTKYCETAKRYMPFLHFFVQVKKWKQNTIAKSDVANDIQYWRDQPVPVFIFHVKEDNSYDIYSALYFILNEKKEEDYRLPAAMGKKKQLEEFFRKEGFLERNYFEWGLLKGNINPIPSLEKTEVKWFFADKMNLDDYRDNINKTLFFALWRYCEDNLCAVWDRETFQFKSEKNISHLKDVDHYMKALESWDNDLKNCKLKATLGLWHAAHEENSQAEKYFIEVINIVETDLQNQNISNELRENLKDNLPGYKGYLTKIRKRNIQIPTTYETLPFEELNNI